MFRIPDAQKRKKASIFKRISANAGFFLFKLLTAAILLGFLAWFGYEQVMKMVLGHFSFFEVGAAGGAYTENEILLVEPVRTEMFLVPDSDRNTPEPDWPYRPRNDKWTQADTLWYSHGMQKKEESKTDNTWEELLKTNYRATHLVDWWEKLLNFHELSYQKIYETDLVSIRTSKNVIIIPGALLLSNDEKQGLKNFIANGGSALFCWSPGCRNENGKWVGFDFMSQLFGGLVDESVVDIAGGTSIILSGDNPVTAMIPPGTHLDLYTYNGFVSMNLVEPRAQSDGFWFKPYWSDQSNGLPKKNVAIARGSYIDGRYIWFGLTPDAVNEHKDNNIIIESLMLNAIDWLKRKTVVNVSVWPSDYQAGGGVLMKTNMFESNVMESIGLLHNTGIAVDLIVEENNLKNLFKPNTLPGSVLISIDSGSEFRLKTVEERTVIIEQKLLNATQTCGKDPIGIFASDWFEEFETLQAVAKNELSVLLSNRKPRYYGPRVQTIRPDFLSRLVPIGLMPKAQLTLDELVNFKNITNEDSLYGAMVSDLNRIHKTGGIYLSIFNPATLAELNINNLPLRIVEQMDSLSFWRVPVESLIERFSAWKGLRVSTTEKTTNRVNLRISNEGKFVLEDIFVKVFLTKGIERVQISSGMVGKAPERIIWDKETGICTFSIQHLGPRSNVLIFLDKLQTDEIDL